MSHFEDLALKYAADFIPPPPMDLEDELPKIPKAPLIQEFHDIAEREKAVREFNEIEKLEQSLKEIEILKEMLAEEEDFNEFPTAIPPAKKKAHCELMANKYCLNDSSR